MIITLLAIIAACLMFGGEAVKKCILVSVAFILTIGGIIGGIGLVIWGLYAAPITNILIGIILTVLVILAITDHLDLTRGN